MKRYMQLIILILVTASGRMILKYHKLFPEMIEKNIYGITSDIIENFIKPQINWLMIIGGNNLYFSATTRYIFAQNNPSVFTLSATNRQYTFFNASREKGRTGFVMFSDWAHKESFLLFLSELSENSLWNKASYFLFVITDVIEYGPGQLNDLLKTFWVQYEILHYAVICSCTKRYFISKHFNKVSRNYSIRAFTFNPFENDGDGKIVLVSREEDPFADKLLDVHGYPVSVALNHEPPFSFKITCPGSQVAYTGFDKIIWKSLLDHINASIFINDFKKTSVNLPLTSGKKGLKKSDIFGNTIRLSAFTKKKYTYPFNMEPASFIVPKAKKLPKWMSFLLPFSLETWLSYFVACFLLAFVWRFFTHYSCDKEVKKVDELGILHVITSGVSVHKFSVLSARLFLLSTLSYNTVFTNSYSGALTSFLTSPQYYPDANSLSDLVNSGLKVGYVISLQNSKQEFSLIDHSDRLTKFFFDNLVMLKSKEEGLGVTVSKRNQSILLMETELKYYLNRPEYHQDGHPLLHHCKVYIVTFMVVYTFRDNFAFVDKLDTLMWRLKESGITRKLLDDVTHETAVELRAISHGPEHVPLTMSHLEGAFYLLLFGTSICVIVFIHERKKHPKTYHGFNTTQYHHARQMRQYGPYNQFKFS
ncbi:uncharacterized protein LOC134538437 [Bacillus rossius redtenbacheri]|uniref:uncharacterized protein LOC134538437 n=1 Tax=Bacillus rossius redtenbacheri TaxID=93214 RepID=UPI002FDD552B